MRGEARHAHIPHNWYHLIEAHGLSPHIDQVLALSEIARLPVLECLRVFGIDVSRLWMLQARIPRAHTTLVPDSPYAAQLSLAGEPPFDWRMGLPPHTARLSELAGQRLEPTSMASAVRYQYARIGLADTSSVPALVPGSLVRIDTTRSQIATCDGAVARTPIYLVDDGKRLKCSHLVRVDAQRVLLVSPNPACDPTELCLPCEATIVGTIDLELRPLGCQPRAPRHPITDDSRLPVSERDKRQSLGAALRAARDRLGLHLRDVHQLTRVVAAECGSGRYAIGLGSLSAYEAHDTLPRHIEKIFALACVYNMDFFELLTLGGVAFDRAVLRPSSGVRVEVPRAYATPDAHDNGAALDTIPEYLPPYVTAFGILPRDVYVVGRSMAILHPALQGAIAVVAPRRNGSVAGSARRTDGERPLYLLQHRDGRYLCGWCFRYGETITVVPHPEIPARPHRVPANDVDVIGKVTAVLRRL